VSASDLTLNLNLRGRVAIVTGGSRGIGRAIVMLLAELGVDCVVNYFRGEEAANETVRLARAKGTNAISVQADVSKLSDAEDLVQKSLEQFKRLDILVCNAGIWEGAPVDEMSEELWDRTIELNLKGTWNVCRAAIPAMKQQRSGRIVVISSTAGQRGEAGYSNYAASKGGQISFVKSLSTELAPWGITANAVAPGWVRTEMTEDALAGPEELRAARESIPLGDVAAPEDIAGPVVFLCSDWARHITGEVLNVNGGSVLCG
jgi:3-oxoacyl-[acyl-carrier protein] reductase